MYKKIKNLLVLVIFTQSFIYSFTSKAQQDQMYITYPFMPLNVNPAYAGSLENTISATLLARRQWFDIPGAPITQTFSIHAPFLNNQLGIGAVIVNDKIGVSNATSALFNWAYHLKVSASGAKLAFGMYGGIRQFRAGYSQLRTSIGNEYDPAFANEISTGMPMVGVGAFYYAKKFYAGISVPQLLNSPQIVDNKIVKHFSHFFFNTGYVFDINDEISIRPSVMIKYVVAAPTSFDLNANIWYKKRFAVGASYRVRDSFDILLEFIANKNISVGYAYDLTLTRLSQYTSGSHEIMIRYQGRKGGGDREKIVTPRQF